MKILATPGYIETLKKHGTDSLLLFQPAVHAIAILSKNQEPSWVIGDPSAPNATTVPEDEGRTIRIQAPFRFYAIRDDHPQDCDCGCSGGSLVTFLLPHEY